MHVGTSRLIGDQQTSGLLMLNAAASFLRLIATTDVEEAVLASVAPLVEKESTPSSRASS